MRPSSFMVRPERNAWSLKYPTPAPLAISGTFFPDSLTAILSSSPISFMRGEQSKPKLGERTREFFAKLQIVSDTREIKVSRSSRSILLPRKALQLLQNYRNTVKSYFYACPLAPARSSLLAMHKITIRLPDRTLAALQSRASTNGRTPADLARHLLNLTLDTPDNPKLPLKSNPRLKL